MRITVTTLHRNGRRFIEAQWIDPVTGLKKTRSTKTANKREADRFAARLEDKLNGEGLQEPTRVTWEQLWKRYDEDVLKALSPNTRDKVRTAANALVRVLNPKLASSLSTDVLVQFQTSLRKEHLAGSTIRGYLADIKRVLEWGERVRLVGRAPDVHLPKASCGMKGRPITGEEYDRFLAALPKVVGEEGVPSWSYFIEGLWLSGLRLEEASILHWTDDRKIAVDMSGKYPMLRIQHDHQKSRRFELLPLTPDFAEFLQRTPPDERRGFVFDPRPLRTPFTVRLSSERMGKLLSKVGEQAGIKVNDGKFASAHDLRRAFGTRWALVVMPAVLQALMRHKSIQTTMQFYVGRNAQSIAEQAWLAVRGNTSGNTSPRTDQPPSSAEAETPVKTGVSE